MPSLVAALRRVAADRPSKELLSFGGLSLSYGAALARAEFVAARLRAAGISPLDRVALFLHNSPSFVEAYLGALLAGAVVVPLNTRYRHDELEHVFGDASPELLVTDPPGRETIRACGLSGCREVVVDAGSDDRAWNALGSNAGIAREPEAGQPAILLYTSGTTGRSKGAILTHGNLLHGARAVVEAWEWTPADRLYLALPLFHMHGLGVGLHGTLAAGASLTLERAFDPDRTRAALAEGTHTLFFGVPTMHTRLVAPGPRPKGLRLVVSGSAPLSPPAF
ncbi:MAG: AMP-binding protein, partial [Acidobacteria bacterium]|nr:AMP-binding protein [Acidobacteriota bacterium]